MTNFGPKKVHGFLVRTPICHIVPISRIYGVSPSGLAKSLILLFWKKRVYSWEGSVEVYSRCFPNLSVPRRPLGAPPRGRAQSHVWHPCVSRSKKLCPLVAPHWGTPGDTPRTTRAVLAPFPDRMVSTKSGQTQLHLGSGIWPILFLCFGNFWPQAKSRWQSHVWLWPISEFFCPHRVPGRELSEFLSAYHVCAKAKSPSLPPNSVSSYSSETVLSKQYSATVSWRSKDRLAGSSRALFRACLRISARFWLKGLVRNGRS